jgi:hypothetical protein
MVNGKMLNVSPLALVVVARDKVCGHMPTAIFAASLVASLGVDGVKKTSENTTPPKPVCRYCYKRHCTCNAELTPAERWIGRWVPGKN